MGSLHSVIVSSDFNSSSTVSRGIVAVCLYNSRYNRRVCRTTQLSHSWLADNVLWSNSWITMGNININICWLGFRVPITGMLFVRPENQTVAWGCEAAVQGSGKTAICSRTQSSIVLFYLALFISFSFWNNFDEYISFVYRQTDDFVKYVIDQLCSNWWHTCYTVEVQNFEWCNILSTSPYLISSVCLVKTEKLFDYSKL